jgi:hypothetical protein
VNDDIGNDVVDELRGIRAQLSEIAEALHWFTILQRDRHELEQLLPE